ncbi:MAG TPA: alcohol acetyltransferase [Candidatus Merdenecus merdavium]|nr:alcohol acetyltransferase [Candidatus Merdenecus merdavium]
MKLNTLSNTTKKTWYKLDLSANVYPTLQRKNFSSVYRITAVMKETVDPSTLQKAVLMIKPRFPTFCTTIRKGFFWRYLEYNKRPGPYVMPDISNPCMPMNFKLNQRYLIRIYYYQNQISLEVFHSLSDGGGATYFLKTLIAVYLRLKGHNIPNTHGVLDIEEEPDPEELEDAYLRYANSKVHTPRSQTKAYRVRGTKEPFYTLNIICGSLSTKKALEVAKSYKVSLTEYFNSVLIYALIQKQKDEGRRKLKPVKIAMPVSLRRFFPSKTLRNFITMIYPSINPQLGEYSFEEILTQIHYYMRYYLNDKFLNADITTNSATQQNPVIRAIPLFIKDLVVRSFYVRVQDKQSTAGLTNLGAVSVPEEMAPFVSCFHVLMGQPFSPRTNCAIISYQDCLTINFASSIVESDVEMYFFRKLIQDGIHVTIQSNREEELK